MTEKEYQLYILKIGVKIGYYRRNAGMTQEELASAADISEVYIGQLEAPNMPYCPSVKVLFKIANALAIKAYKLLDIEDE